MLEISPNSGVHDESDDEGDAEDDLEGTLNSQSSYFGRSHGIGKALRESSKYLL